MEPDSPWVPCCLSGQDGPRGTIDVVVRASPREVQGSAEHEEGKDKEKHGPSTDLLAHLWIAFCACVCEVCDVKSTTARKTLLDDARISSFLAH